MQKQISLWMSTFIYVTQTRSFDANVHIYQRQRMGLLCFHIAMVLCLEVIINHHYDVL